MGHEFELEKEITVAATPDQVWDAIATGPGVDAWFMGRSEIEAREGGTTSFTMAGQTELSTVTAWEPGKRFAYTGEAGDDGAFMAVEYLIEGRDGGSTTVRLVHSGILGGDWETEFEAMKTGWDMYLHTLAAYLRHFAGRASTTASGFRPGVDGPRFWAAVRERFGLGTEVAEGDRVRLSDPELGTVEGVVDYVDLPSFLGVRTDDALLRFIHSGEHRGSVAVLGHHLYAPGADQETAERGWQNWLGGLPA
ncbi:SRPBCC domain-containing protein [Spirillospora sp. NPDC047279]|uniref:SRPBCC family protein n=1 Tax=Spirillospora sp. NPDC047279 TaxID=3155478 RepID=UPI0033EE56D6